MQTLEEFGDPTSKIVTSYWKNLPSWKFLWPWMDISHSTLWLRISAIHKRLKPQEVPNRRMWLAIKQARSLKYNKKKTLWVEHKFMPTQTTIKSLMLTPLPELSENSELMSLYTYMPWKVEALPPNTVTELYSLYIFNGYDYTCILFKSHLPYNEYINFSYHPQFHNLKGLFTQTGRLIPVPPNFHTLYKTELCSPKHDLFWHFWVVWKMTPSKNRGSNSPDGIGLKQTVVLHVDVYIPWNKLHGKHKSEDLASYRET